MAKRIESSTQFFQMWGKLNMVLGFRIRVRIGSIWAGGIDITPPYVVKRIQDGVNRPDDIELDDGAPQDAFLTEGVGGI